MQVVLRPVSDAFLREVVFPASQAGVADLGAGIGSLLEHIADPTSRTLLEVVYETTSASTFYGIEDERWSQLVYSLLFHEWVKGKDGWRPGVPYEGYAGEWDETLHLVLMLEEPNYPYADKDKSKAYRDDFVQRPNGSLELATMLTGWWDSAPGFPPDQLLSNNVGDGYYNAQKKLARADWSWRSWLVLSRWAARMPSALSHLLEREAKRLRPISAPERHELLEYWLGRTHEAPLLAVSFSGLGPHANQWIRDLGSLARLLRRAAEAQQGVTVVLSREGRQHDRTERDL